jgi:hypothetical protein
LEVGAVCGTHLFVVELFPVEVGKPGMALDFCWGSSRAWISIQQLFDQLAYRAGFFDRWRKLELSMKHCLVDLNWLFELFTKWTAKP